MVKDAAGNLYIADAGNYRIRKINTAGTISTIAGNGTPGFSGDGGPATAAQILSVTGICIDGAGNLYIADLPNQRVRKISASGIITTVAGNGTAGYMGDGGAATAAQLNQPSDVAIDAAGNLYIADKANNRVRKVTSSGTITTYAGYASVGYSGDGGAATDAQLNAPTGVGVDGAGSLYIADQTNGRIRKVNSAGIIETVAGNGVFGYAGDGAAATGAALYQPVDVHADAGGNIWIADQNNDRIRKVNPAGIISTIAGNGMSGFTGDGGLATAAQMDGPAGVYVDAGGNVYFADQTNNRIRVVNTSGVINTVSGVSRYIGDGGPATNAELLTPTFIAVDKHDNVYFCETNGHRVRKIAPDGTISTIAGTGIEGVTGMGDGSMATAVDINRPEAITVDTAGNVYFGEFTARIRKVSPSGIITSVAGMYSPGHSGDGGPATAAFITTQGITVDTAGNFYMTCSGEHRARRIDPSGTITTFAGTGVWGFSGDGGGATGAQLNYPLGIRTDRMGNIYIAEGNSAIRKVTPSGDIWTVAGIGGGHGYSGDGGPATSAELNRPQDVQTLNDTLIISDALNARIRMVDAAGNITTIAGNGVTAHSGDGGPATAASMWMPAGIALGADNNTLYIVDFGASVIRKVSNLKATTPTTNINEPYRELRAELFPNPVTDEVRLYANTEIKHVAITNLLGQQMAEQVCNGKQVTVKVAHLPQGLYLLRINNKETLRFVKE
jgi:sugar lactone lactonase YvrE